MHFQGPSSQIRQQLLLPLSIGTAVCIKDILKKPCGVQNFITASCRWSFTALIIIAVVSRRIVKTD